MIHPQYFIDNIGNKYLPHYERLNLLVYLSEQPKMSVESTNCPSQIVKRFEDIENSKYITIGKTGHFFWKKTFYTLSHDGRAYFNHYKEKCGIVADNIRHYILKLEEIPSIEDFIWAINEIVSARFVSVADYVTQSAIISGVFVKLQHMFKSLFVMNRYLKDGIKEYYEKTTGVDISMYSAYHEHFEFFLLCAMVEFHEEDIFLEYFDPENKPETAVEESPRESVHRTNISINFQE